MVQVLVTSYFCSWTRFHESVARSNGNPTWRVFQSYGIVLQFAAMPNFADLIDEDGGVLATKREDPHSP